MTTKKAKVGRFMQRNTLGLIALFVALGGTSYAAVSLPKDSVGSAQIRARAVDSAEIKSGAVTKSKIENNSVTSEKIAQGTIQAADIKSGVIPTVPSTATPTDGSVTAAKLAKLPSARAFFPSGQLQTIANTGTPVVAFPSTEYSNAGLAVGTANGGTTLTVPTTGVYSITAQVNWFDDSLTVAGPPVVRVDDGIGNRSLFINGPGGAIYGSSTVPAAADDFTRQSVSATAYLAAGTALFLAAGQTSDGPLNIRGSLQQVHFAATLLTP